MVFKEDTAGQVVGIGSEDDPDPFSDTPVYSYCITQTVTITGDQDLKRKPSTGRRHKKIVSEGIDYSCSIESMYLRIDEIDTINIFGRNQYIAIYFVYLSYIRQPNTQKEWHALKRCKADSFSITSKENGLAKCNASFMAEEYHSG